MGLAGSTKKKYERLPEAVTQHTALFNMLGLKPGQLLKLYKVFCAVDTDMSGELSLAELLEHLKLSKTPFTNRVFSIFDEDGSGEIDFREFVLSTWNYCTLTKPSLLIFAFDLYDADQSGTMELREMVDMCKDVYGSSFAQNRLACQILEKIERMLDVSRGDGEISVDKFAGFCENHPGLLYPAFAFQQSLQKKIIGQGFWRSIASQRVTLPTGAQVRVQDLLKSHVDESKFKELAYKNKVRDRKTLVPDQSEVNGNFADMHRLTGTVAERRSGAQRLQKASRKIHAANTIAKISSVGISNRQMIKPVPEMPITGPNAPHRKHSQKPRPIKGPLNKNTATATRHVDKRRSHGGVQRERQKQQRKRHSIAH